MCSRAKKLLKIIRVVLGDTAANMRGRLGQFQKCRHKNAITGNAEYVKPVRF